MKDNKTGDLVRLYDSTVAPKLQQDINWDKMEIELQGKDIAEARYRQSRPENPCKRLDRETYLYKPTGEIRAYKPHERRMDGSLRRTFRMLRGRIRTNFQSGLTNQLLITLTYAENMTDQNRLYDDFDRFWHRVKRYAFRHDLGYIAVAEPQQRGAWHFHILVKSLNLPVLYIPDSVVRALWGLGNTTTERLARADDAGQYYCAYFTDITKPGANPHKRAKAARLHLYPAGFKFFRASRNLAKPETVQARYKAIKREYGIPCRTKVTVLYKVIDGQRVIKNVLFYALFNRARATTEPQKSLTFVDISPPDGKHT